LQLPGDDPSAMSFGKAVVVGLHPTDSYGGGGFSAGTR